MNLRLFGALGIEPKQTFAPILTESQNPVKYISKRLLGAAKKFSHLSTIIS